MIRFSIRNPVVVNLLAISVVVVGVFSMINLPREVFPPVSLNWVYIITNWSGATPEEMERLVTIPLEEEVVSVERIESITSRSYQSRSVISVRFESMPADEFRAILQDLQSEIDQVNDLPEAADDPLVMNFTADDFMPLINVTLATTTVSEREMMQLAREIRSEIKLIDGVKDVNITGERESEVWVAVDPARLTAVGLSLSQVVEALASKNIGFPLGSVVVGSEEFLIRMGDEFTGVADIEAAIIAGSRESGLVRVRDIADVRTRLQERETSMRFNGAPALTLVVTKIGGASSMGVIEEIKAFVAEFQKGAAAQGVTFSFTGDSSRQIEGILGILQRNAVVGMALVIMTLYFFLGFRNALFAALGIPITFMVTFIFLNASGNSFNGNSLFGLVLILGVVVDDAIIVIENSYAYMQRGMSPVQAAYHGAREVATPVLAATGTTIAGFLPLMLMPGIVGQFLKVVPIVVSLALLASLFEAFLVLPSHIAEWSSRKEKRTKSSRGRVRLFSALNKIYVPLVCRAVRYRYYVIAVFVLALGGVKPLLDHLGVEMFRDEEFPSVIIQVRMPPSVSLDETERVLVQLEERLSGLQCADILGYSTSSGFMMTETEWYFKSSVGQIQLDLADMQLRTTSNDELIEDIRSAFSTIVGPLSIDYMKLTGGPPTGSPLEVKVKGKYLDGLKNVADEMVVQASAIDGLFDVSHDFTPGKKALLYNVDHAAAARLGVSPSVVAREMMIAFEGLEATTYRDGDEEIGVVVKFAPELTEGFRALDQMKIRSASGAMVSLSDLTVRSEGVGIDEIRRFNQDRAITISGKNDPDVIQLDKIASKISERFEDISEKYPGHTIDFRGEWNEFKKAFDQLAELFIVGILLIYMILGAQFKSFLQPFIILFTIPFAIIGAVVGLLAMGAPFSIATMYGIVALAGVAVNDSLVLVDFINKGRSAGVGRYRSIIQAGRRRLRPILSTSITTVFGLLPMAIGIGGKSVVWGPLATTIVWGLSVATILTLFVIPALYAVTDDLKSTLGLRLSHDPHRI